MKKIFQPVEIEIIYYHDGDIVTDIISESPGEYVPGENDTPMLPVGKF